MIPKSLSVELEKIFSKEELEERRIEDGSYRFIELEHKRDKEKITDLGIIVDDLGPYKVIFLWEEHSSLEIGGYLVVDNLSMGSPSLGGTRFIETVSVREIASLARGMTLKNAAADLPFGGGKSGIIAVPNMSPKERAEIISNFAQLIQRYIAIYNPGPDVGTNDEDMKTFAIYNGLNNVVSKTVDMGGNRIDILGAAAGGAVVAIDEIFSKFYKLRELPQFKKYPIIELKDSSLLIQGFGAVGFNVAKLLVEGKITYKNEGAPKLKGVSDVEGYILSEDGFDIYELLRFKTPKHEVSSIYYENKRNEPDKFKFCNVPNDLLRETADILVPATPIANYIGVDDKFNPSMTLDHIGHWKIIVEAANTLSVEKEKIEERHRLERILFHKRGIFIATDYLVNSGGVIFAAFEKLLPTPKELDIPEDIRGDREKVQQWLDKHKDEFEKLAEERRKLAENKRDQVIRENITIFINTLVKNPDKLPYQVAEQISLERIIHRDRFVKDVMSKNFPSGKLDMTVTQIAEILVKENKDFLPIIDEQNFLIGVVTDWDITKFVMSNMDKNVTIREIMTDKEHVITVAPTDNIIETVTLLHKNKLSAVPVLNDQHEVIGVVTSDRLVQNTLLRLLEY